MKPFTKLNILTDVNLEKTDDVFIKYGKGNIDFSNISKEIENKLLSIIPEENRKYFNCSLMRSNSYIKPHTDSDRLVGINFYVQPSDALTLFFQKKPGILDTKQVVGQTNGYIYEMDELILGDFFKAQLNEIWVLDVTQIHSVINGNKTERFAYSLSSNKINYKETLSILKHLI